MRGQSVGYLSIIIPFNILVPTRPFRRTHQTHIPARLIPGTPSCVMVIYSKKTSRNPLCIYIYHLRHPLKLSNKRNKNRIINTSNLWPRFFLCVYRDRARFAHEPILRPREYRAAPRATPIIYEYRNYIFL